MLPPRLRGDDSVAPPTLLEARREPIGSNSRAGLQAYCVQCLRGGPQRAGFRDTPATHCKVKCIPQLEGAGLCRAQGADAACQEAPSDGPSSRLGRWDVATHRLLPSSSASPG